MSRYLLCRADLSGTEDVISRYAIPESALRDRDSRRKRSNYKSVNWRVLDDDDPERGELDWDDLDADYSSFRR
jgi:hypothetical protein